jgi:hypothetical protein
MKTYRRAITIACLACITMPASAPVRRDDGLSRDYRRTVSMLLDRRTDAVSYARDTGIELSTFQARFGASGLIRCGDAVGSGQVTLSSRVITTAAHVFYGTGGKLRGDSCTFESASAPGVFIPIDMRSLITGSARPMEERATLDWAVAKLVSPADKISPYPIASSSETPTPIVMYGGGHGPAAKMSIEQCSTRRVTAVAPEGVREVAFDCSAAHGGSGAALLNAKDEMIAIFVGYRSVDAAAARPFSEIHYNFAITLEGSFRSALTKAAEN